MEARIVPLASAEAGAARVGGNAAERLALLRELSDTMWRHGGKPFPSYTRRTMPVVITPLSEHTRTR